MKNHYTALVRSGFLSKAKKQIGVAKANLLNTQYDDTMSSFTWYFDLKNKKLDFDELYISMDIPTYIREAYLNGAEEDDVIILNSPEFIIFCAQKKRMVEEAAVEEYDYNGILPYHITKRKIDNQIYWFCMSWLQLPFIPPSYN